MRQNMSSFIYVELKTFYEIENIELMHRKIANMLNEVCEDNDDSSLMNSLKIWPLLNHHSKTLSL